jgi:DNA polymerase-3 subunit alpha (Gram-positive type)
LTKSSKKVEDNTINIYSGNNFIYNFLKNKNLEKLMHKVIVDIFGIECTVFLIYDKNLYNEKFLEESQNKEKSI